MARRWLGAIVGLVTSAGVALAQPPAPPVWTPNISPYGSTQAVASQPPGPPPSSPSFVEEDVFGLGTSLGGDRDARVWFQAEYLRWRLRTGGPTPPVLLGTIPTALAGTPDLPASAITAINGTPTDYNYGEQNGVRVGAGVWLDGAREWGVEASGFQLERGTRSFRALSNGDPVIGPVFNDPVTNRQTIILYAIPGARAAQLDESMGDSLWGVEANVRRQIPALFFADRLDLLAGFRHLQFGESLDLGGAHVAAAGVADPVARITAYNDHFGVFNKFYGAQIGLASHSDVGRFTVDVIGKLALGGMQEVVKINGSTTLIDPAGAPGTIVTRPGGVLTQPTSLGRYNHGDFAVVPELTVNLGCRITERLRLTVGYNFLYINDVFRVGSQFDRVDGRQVFGSTAFVPNAQPAPTRPGAPGGENGAVFWAQGFNAGLELSY